MVFDLASIASNSVGVLWSPAIKSSLALAGLMDVSLLSLPSLTHGWLVLESIFCLYMRPGTVSAASSRLGCAYFIPPSYFHSKVRGPPHLEQWDEKGLC